MTQAALHPAVGHDGARQGTIFFLIAAAVALAAATLAGFAPLGLSIVTVFLFAGPHNWMEARFFLSQMPARWGPLRGYFQLGIGGVVFLGIAFFLMPVLGRQFEWQVGGWSAASASWNSALVLWITALATLHGKIKNKDRFYLWPIGFLVVAIIWAIPTAWEFALVYLHPVIAILFLQRILKRKRPDWLPAYYAVLALIPLLLAGLWWRLHDAPALLGQDMLTMRISQHAGAQIATGISAHFLVAAHTFLEMLHYGVWVVAIPLISFGASGRRPWRTDGIPLARRSFTWRVAFTSLLALGAAAVVILWACFLADYPLTRDIYFTAAILHVLAEFPFLLRLL
jgi:hypothetical protein